MNDDTLLSRLAPITDEQAAAMVGWPALAELAEDIVRTPQHQTPTPSARRLGTANPTRRRLTWAAAGTLAAAAAATVALTVTAPGGHPAVSGKSPANAAPLVGGRPSPATSATLTAWTVTKSGDGTLTVTIRELKDASGLQATLRADGARVVVTGSLASPAACSEWRGGNYRLGDQVVQTSNRTGLPSANGDEFTIRPSLIPAGALLWLGLSQTGKPAGVVGPPGPMSVGYLTATQVCAGA